MKVTKYRGDFQTQSLVSLPDLMRSMRVELKSQPISTMRHYLQYGVTGENDKYLKAVPLVAFGGTFKNVSGEQVMIDYNGLVLLEVNHLSGMQEAESIRNVAAESLQTLAAFVGSSGKSVKIVIPFTLPDGSLPKGKEQVELFHAYAYKKAAEHYKLQLSGDIDLKEPKPGICSRFTFDRDLYFNPEAIPVRIDQPWSTPEVFTCRDQQKNEADPLLRLMPGIERSQLIETLFCTSMQEALSVFEQSEDREDVLPYLSRLAENCFHSGVPEEDAVRWTLAHRHFKQHCQVVRDCFRSVYLLGKNFGGKPCIRQERTLVVQLEEFLRRRYEFRYNVLKGNVEYREREIYRFRFTDITERGLNGISLNAQEEGIPAWDKDVKRYVCSDRIPLYSPVDDYLENLPEWDGQDYIRQLAACVPCDNPLWQDLFYRWFLCMVAHWRQMDTVHSNSVSPLLTGNPGFGKSTFLKRILPRELQDYYTDSIDVSRKRDAELYLSRFLLVNIDEFDAVSASHQAFLKHLLQKPVVKIRQPYGQSVLTMNRYASFAATCNPTDMLTDPTGSRRFIAVEVTGRIDNESRINYSQLYAQAVALLEAGERYWFTYDEEVVNMKNNTAFEQVPLEEQLFFQYFTAMDQRDEEGEWMMPIEILQKLQQKSGIKLSNSRLSRFGRLLKKNRVASKRTNRGTCYYVKEV